MFAKSSFLFTAILGFIFMLLTSPLFAAALPVAAHQARNPTSLMGRTYHANSNAHAARAPIQPIVLRSAAAEAEGDALAMRRSERFALRMERARRLA